MSAPFRALLIANRGEIACRVIRTARAMGIATVAVHSDADAGALHVRMADRAVRIGPAPARDSYLSVPALIDAARATGCDALHPGYGFLSERAELAEACAAAGIAWVGPHPDAIRGMGDKIGAKRLARGAGVPCVPGHDGPEQDTASLVAAARALGLPVMVKAAAGGGGKGMRPVHDAGDLPAAIDAARVEAERAFGDGRLLIERLIERPRHVEVQILADRHGAVVTLPDRDCSIQRGNRKLIEEAPAPNLPEATRAAMRDASIALARAIGYDSAGTVEFVMDARTAEVFFLEMNTRLQVEHTVTEAITGLDLVERQIRVAAGEPLDLAQSEIRARGHAIEARLTAEDPAAGFRPRTGRLLAWRAPEGVRVDAGVEAGSVVGSDYDSLVAKLIAHGPDRAASTARLRDALGRLRCPGLVTNRTWLRAALARPAFAEERMTTRFVEEEMADEADDGGPPPAALAALAAQLSLRPAAGPPSRRLGAFRLSARAGLPARSTWDVDGVRVYLEGDGGAWTARLDGTAHAMAARLEGGVLTVWDAGGERRVFDLTLDDGALWLSGPDLDLHASPRPAADAAAAEGSVAAPDVVAAPMDGLLSEVRVGLGDDVAAGDVVAVPESMKLLTNLTAGVSGVVAEVHAAPGDTVAAGRPIMRIAES